MRLSELPVAERPRERMLARGADRVDDVELLAIVLGTGRGSGEDALGLAERLLREGGGLAGLGGADLERLQALGGVGPVKATRVAAAFELGRRLGPATSAAHPVSNGPNADPATTAAPVEPPHEPPPTWSTVADALRGQVAIGERALLAFQLERPAAPVTLALGAALGAETRAGAVLARLLAGPTPGAWWIVGVRPGGPPQKREREAAERLLAAARLVDVPCAGIVLVAGQRAWPLGGDEAPAVPVERRRSAP